MLRLLYWWGTSWEPEPSVVATRLAVRLRVSLAHLQVTPLSARGSRIGVLFCICAEVVVELYAGVDLVSSVSEISLMY